MSAIPQKKLCWNCEGEVSFKEEDCPYCGVYLNGMPLEHSESNSQATQLSTEENISLSSTTNGPATLTDTDNNVMKLVTPLALLLGGSLCALFGTILALFSHNDILTLKWSATYWYLYSGLSVPMLIYGYLTLNKLDEE